MMLANTHRGYLMGGIQSCLLSENAFQEKDPGPEIPASPGPRPVAKIGTRDLARKATICGILSIPLGSTQTPLHCELPCGSRDEDSGTGIELDLNCRCSPLTGLSQAAYIFSLGFTACPMGPRRIIKTASRKA